MTTDLLTRRNRYLFWLEHGGTPPLRASLGLAREASDYFKRRAISARHALARDGASWAHFDSLDRAMERHGAIVEQIDSSVGTSVRTDYAQALKWAGAQRIWYSKFLENLRKHPAHQAIEALGQQPDATFIQRLRVSEFLKLTTANSALFDKQLDTLQRSQKLRESRHDQDRKARGGVMLTGRDTDLHRDYTREAKLAGLARGIEHYLFLPNTDAAFAARTESSNRKFREYLWLEDNYAPVPTTAIEKSRQLRQAAAQADQFQTHMDSILSERCVIKNASSIQRAIRHALEAVRQDSRALKQFLFTEMSARDKTTLNAPWDLPYAQTQLLKAVLFDGDQLKAIFPWRETALKMLGELFSVGGWKPHKPTRIHGQGIWSVVHMQLQREDMRKCHLFYAPFRPREGAYAYSAGDASAVLGAWDPEPNKAGTPVVWITQALDKATQSFDVDALGVLCHEVGHALHFLGLPGQMADEASAIPEDLSEVPSYLFQLYCQDPCTLARWASRKGPAAARRPRYWKRKLAVDGGEILEHQKTLIECGIDIEAHHSQEAFEAIAKRAWRQAGSALHEADQSWRRTYIWEDHTAGMDYTHPWCRGVVRRLVTIPDNGCLNSSTIGDLFLSMQEDVLNKAPTPDRAAKAWKRWAGETFLQSARHGLLAYSAQHGRACRKELARVRKAAQKRREA